MITLSKTVQAVWQGNPPSPNYQPNVTDIVQQQTEIINGANAVVAEGSTYADAAQAAAAVAESARDAATVNAGVYTDTASGIAGTTSGQQFMVVTADDIIRYQNSSGTAVEVARYPSTASIVGVKMASASQIFAYKLVEGTSNTIPVTYLGYVFTAGTSYTARVVAKAGERRYLNIYCNTNWLIDAKFDLHDGVCTGTGASITPLGNGWYLCEVTAVATTSGSANYQLILLNDVGVKSYTGDGVSGLYLSGTDAVSLKVTGAATELLATTDVGSASWTKADMSVSPITLDNTTDQQKLAAAYEAAIGDNDAIKIVEASGSSLTPAFYRSLTSAAGSSYEMTVIAKAAERGFMQLYNNSSGWTFDCTFNLNAGTAIGTGASITALGEGWYECKVSVTASSVSTANAQIRPKGDLGAYPYNGDGVSGIYVRSASMKKDGVEQWIANGSLSSAAWSTLNCSVRPNATTYRTLGLFGGAAATPQPYAGKKVSIVGTSITAQNHYIPPLNTLMGVTIQNLGYSGGSLANGPDAGALKVYNQIPLIQADADLVILEAGTNDFGKDNSTLGARGDTTTDTFYGALYAAAVAIIAQAPNAKIVYLTPYGASTYATYTVFATNSGGKTLQDFQQAVRDVADFLGFPCIDVGREAGFGYLTNTPITSDGLHPNDLGGVQFAKYVYAKLLELYDAGMMG